MANNLYNNFSNTRGSWFWKEIFVPDVRVYDNVTITGSGLCSRHRYSDKCQLCNLRGTAGVWRNIWLYKLFGGYV